MPGTVPSNPYDLPAAANPSRQAEDARLQGEGRSQLKLAPQCHDRRMSTRPSQMTPMLRKINLQVGFRPEYLFDAAAWACQCNVTLRSMCVYTATTRNTMNIASHKTGLRITHSYKPQAVCIS
jgi:hypothetical protein